MSSSDAASASDGAVVDAGRPNDSAGSSERSGSPDAGTGLCPIDSQGTWVAMSTSGAPVPSSDPSLYWTGREVLVYSTGQTNLGGPSSPRQGLYDPCTDTWRATDQLPSYYRPDFVVTVDSAHAMFFFSPPSVFEKVDLISGKATAPGLAGALTTSQGSFLSVGTGLLAWGGLAPLNPANPGDGKLNGTQAGAVFDIASSTWRPMSTTSAPAPRIAPSVWTGTYFAVWGGYSSDNTGTVECSIQYPDAASGCPIYQDGALYHVATDTWKAMNGDGAPAARYQHILAWTGDRILVWGGEQPGVVDPSSGYLQDGPRLRDGGLYDVASGTWTPTAPCPYTGFETVMAELWTGDRLLVTSNGHYDGWLFDPHSNTWSALAAPNSSDTSGMIPVAQAGAAILTGTLADVPSVSLLLPGESSWRSFALTANGARLWTGKQLIYWGGATYIGSCPSPRPAFPACDPPPNIYGNAGWIFTP